MLPRIAIFAIPVIGSALFWAEPVSAQLVPDGTLGEEPTRVVPGTEIEGVVSDRIEGGARRGGNLFHSFQEFNVERGRGAYFSNPSGVERILTRITGNNPSSIQGKLGVLGEADLFLLNPNGIIFGRDASLDLGGSFVASTADGLQFDSEFDFKASDPQAPPLLTTNMPVGLQFRATPGSIVNRSRAVTDANRFEISGLSVERGKSIALLGGNLQFEGGSVTVTEGRIELGGILEEGTISIDSERLDPNQLYFEFPEEVQRSNLLIRDGTVRIFPRNMTGASSGVRVNDSNSIVIHTGRIILEDSHLGVGFRLGGGEIEPIELGSIIIDATGLIDLKDSQISNRVQSGDSGDILINGYSVRLNESEILVSSSFSGGTLGRILLVVEKSVLLSRSSIYNDPGFDNRFSDSGEIKIVSKNLYVDNSQIRAIGDLSANGNLGGGVNSIHIEVSDVLRVIGEGSGIFSRQDSGVFPVNSNVDTGGNISIKAGSLIMRNGAILALLVSGMSFPSINLVLGGSIEINVENSVVLSDSSVLNSSTLAETNIGNINIRSASLILSNGGQISVNSQPASSPIEGRVNAGQIDLNVSDLVSISGTNLEGLSSGLTAITSDETGEAGNIEIKTGTLQVSDGGTISVQTFDNGIGGSITAEAEVIEILDGGQILASTFGNGQAGSITLSASERLSLRGKDLSFSERLEQLGRPEPNDFTADLQYFVIPRPPAPRPPGLPLPPRSESTSISALESVSPSESGSVSEFPSLPARVLNISESSGIFSNTEEGSTGRGGNIQILDTGQLSVADGAGIGANSNGEGSAGNIDINANSLRLEQGSISTATATQTGGNITLNAPLLLLRRNSHITATAGTARAGGDGGNITLDTAAIAAFPGENSDITANAFEGAGGRIEISADGIFGLGELTREDLQEQLGTPELTQIENPSQQLESNDIVAISQADANLSGQIVFNTPDVDSTQGIVELPENIVDPEELVSENPCAQGERSEFVDLGRGGLPANPEQLSARGATQVEWIEPVFPETAGVRSQKRPNPTLETIVPARGWVLQENGKVKLIDRATAEVGRTSRLEIVPTNCTRP